MKPSSPNWEISVQLLHQPRRLYIFAIERFVCQLYLPKTTFTKVKDLRWLLFRKKQAVWKTSSNTRRSAWRDSACLLSSYGLEQQPSMDGNVKKMNGNLSWHSYRQHPRPSSSTWNATVLRNVVPTTDVSVAKAGLKCTDLCTCSEDEICYNVGDDFVKKFDDSSDEDDE